MPRQPADSGGAQGLDGPLTVPAWLTLTRTALVALRRRVADEAGIGDKGSRRR